MQTVQSVAEDIKWSHIYAFAFDYLYYSQFAYLTKDALVKLAISIATTIIVSAFTLDVVGTVLLLYAMTTTFLGVTGIAMHFLSINFSYNSVTPLIVLPAIIYEFSLPVLFTFFELTLTGRKEYSSTAATGRSSGTTGEAIFAGGDGLLNQTTATRRMRIFVVIVEKGTSLLCTFCIFLVGLLIVIIFAWAPSNRTLASILLISLVLSFFQGFMLLPALLSWLGVMNQRITGKRYFLEGGQDSGRRFKLSGSREPSVGRENDVENSPQQLLERVESVSSALLKSPGATKMRWWQRGGGGRDERQDTTIGSSVTDDDFSNNSYNAARRGSAGGRSLSTDIPVSRSIRGGIAIGGETSDTNTASSIVTPLPSPSFASFSQSPYALYSSSARHHQHHPHHQHQYQQQHQYQPFASSLNPPTRIVPYNNNDFDEDDDDDDDYHQHHSHSSRPRRSSSGLPAVDPRGERPPIVGPESYDGSGSSNSNTDSSTSAAGSQRGGEGTSTPDSPRSPTQQQQGGPRRPRRSSRSLVDHTFGSLTQAIPDCAHTPQTP
eukprot:TRINITY_DN2099_c2_g1_i1.p1 TRINITY_DN2099_c2_g1~~TRINITY_DN2099_c2_g1_i1.p1  ORF type:complete len:548 (+),score=110.22 TRINITY_DN2099_c2_g1_i1:107-1750(+)